MRQALKAAVLAVTYLLVAPGGCSAKLFRWIFRSNALFEMLAQAIALVPGLPGDYARACFYHQTLAESHLDARFQFGSIVSKFETRVGRRAHIALWASVGLADIEDEAVIGNRVVVLSGRHQHDFEDTSRPALGTPSRFTRVRIGRRSFVGDNSVVMANVGEGTVVGAGSVVVQDVPDFVVAVGNPARVVRERKPAG